MRSDLLSRTLQRNHSRLKHVGIIRKLQRQIGITFIYVTHDQVEAMTLADRVVVLRFGHDYEETCMQMDEVRRSRRPRCALRSAA
jgi:ABC-type sugar transport system ATPase subunit